MGNKDNVINNFQNANLSDNATGVKFENCPIEKNITQYTLTLAKLECIFGKPKFDSQRLIQVGARVLVYFWAFIVSVFCIIVASSPEKVQSFNDLFFGLKGIFYIIAAAIFLLIFLVFFFETSYRKQKMNLTHKSRSTIKKGFILYLFIFFFITLMYIFTGFHKLAFLSFMVFTYLLIVGVLTKKLFVSITGEQSRVFAKQKKL